MAGILGFGAGSVNAPTTGNLGGLLQTSNQQGWGTDANGNLQQVSQNVLGVGAANQAGGYAGMVNQQGQGYGQQFGQLAGQYGQEGAEQYGQLQGAQAQGNAALANLQQAAAGTTPSAAQIQMQQGTDQAMRQQMALANSSRGGFGLANAQYNAANQGAALQQAAVDQTAALRAQEMAQAQQAYMQGSLGMGNLASQSAQGFQGQQIGALNAGAQNQLGYEQSGQNAVLGGEQLQQGYNAQGLSALNNSSQNQLGWGQVNAGQQAANSGMWGKIIGGGLTALGAVGGAMVGGPAGAVAGGALGNAAGSAVAGATDNSASGAGNSVGSDERIKTEVADAARAEGYKQGAYAAIQGVTRDPGARAMIEQKLGPRIPIAGADTLVSTPDGYVPLSQAPAGTPMQEANDQPRMHAAVPQQKAAPMVAPQPPPPVAQAGILPSDERLKDSPGNTEPPVDRFLGSLQPKTFQYKDPSYEPNPTGSGDRYLGIMAQDLERTPEGAKLVSEDQGYKTVNVPALAGASAAALGRLHERLSKLEGRRGAGVR